MGIAYEILIKLKCLKYQGQIQVYLRNSQTLAEIPPTDY